MHKSWRVAALVAAVVAAATVAGGASASGTVGTTFPAGFPTILDASLGTPVLGFGAAGPVRHTPVIFLHGNNDTPFPTTCNPYGQMQNVAQYFADHGYATSELWGLGYQGDQCDLLTTPTNRSGAAHSTVANIPDLDRFVRAVLAYTGADRVDIVAHSLGVTLARAWMKQMGTGDLVRRFVAIDGPNHGIVDCSPDPFNYWALPSQGGFSPDSAICQEYGRADSPFLTWLNAGGETPGPTEYLVIRNVGPDFVYASAQDGLLPAVPAEDSLGRPHDFSNSADLAGARELLLTGQGQYDAILGTSHLGIVNSPTTWRAAHAFLAGIANGHD
jgi:pimeloyl-ACP methyl ester carboxylesterase